MAAVLPLPGMRRNGDSDKAHADRERAREDDLVRRVLRGEGLYPGRQRKDAKEMTMAMTIIGAMTVSWWITKAVVWLDGEKW